MKMISRTINVFEYKVDLTELCHEIKLYEHTYNNKPYLFMNKKTNIVVGNSSYFTPNITEGLDIEPNDEDEIMTGFEGCFVFINPELSDGEVELR